MTDIIHGLQWSNLANLAVSTRRLPVNAAYSRAIFLVRTQSLRFIDWLIRISVSLGIDKLNVTLSYASASQAAFSQGNFKVS